MAGRGGVPVDADAVFLNLTAVSPDGAGYLTAYPCGATRPLTSNVNYGTGDVVPNAVLAKIGSGGKVCIFTLAASDIIADVNGYVPPNGSPNTAVPARVLETRVGPTLKTIDGEFEGIGKRPAGATVELTVAGRGGVPADADAVFLNLTAVAPDGFGFLTAYPCGSTRPLTSNVNYSPGDVSPNAVLAKIGAGGKVCIYTKAGSDIIADVNGFVPNGGTPGTVLPARILETRQGPGLVTVDRLFEGIGRRAAGSTLELTVAGRGGVPADSDAVFLNVTAISPDGPGFITVYPCGSPRPQTSNVNYIAGDVAPNSVLAKIGEDGKVCIFTLAAADIIVDASGHVPEPVLEGLVEVSQGRNHACALDHEGVVYCWGVHIRGELGLADTSQFPTNKATPQRLPGFTALDVEAGDQFTSAVRSDGRPFCWGYNANGQVGDGSNVQRIVPTAVSGLSGIDQITTGWRFACALSNSGVVSCWGENHSGQLGDGTKTDSSTPVTVTGLPAGKTPVSIDAGLRHACAVMDDGTASCWGLGSVGQLGDGAGSTNVAPVVVTGLSDVAEISAGQNHTCARLENGTVQCWGQNQYLGNGVDTGTQLTPTAVGGLSGVTDIDAGFDNTCVALGNGGGRCWGDADFGENGDGNIGFDLSPVSMAGAGQDIVSVATGDDGDTSCAVLEDTTAVCWGYNGNFELGAETGTQFSLTPVAVGS